MDEANIDELSEPVSPLSSWDVTSRVTDTEVYLLGTWNRSEQRSSDRCDTSQIAVTLKWCEAVLRLGSYEPSVTNPGPSLTQTTCATSPHPTTATLRRLVGLGRGMAIRGRTDEVW